MALMQDDARELLGDSSEELSDTSYREGPPGSANVKRYIAFAVAIATVACAGLAGGVHRLVATGSHAQFTKLTDELYMEERTHACDTKFDFNELVRSNLDNKGPNNGEEGFVVRGSYHHAEDPPVDLELHLHAITPYRLTHGGGLLHPFSHGGDKMIMIPLSESQDTTVHVEIVSPGTHTLHTVPQLAFTFFDLDGHAAGCEAVTLEPANDVVMAQDTRVEVDLSRRDEGIVVFTNRPGSASLPSSISSFDHESMRSHSAEVIFYHVSSFNITMHTGPCDWRGFGFVARANVQCNPGSDGEIPGVDIQPAKPVPQELTPAVPRCLSCWIHPSLSFIPPCTDTETFWARLCE